MHSLCIFQQTFARAKWRFPNMVASRKLESCFPLQNRMWGIDHEYCEAVNLPTRRGLNSGIGEISKEMKIYRVILVAFLSVPQGIVAQDLAAGKTQFVALCSGCHGSDGAGGEHGPNIVDPGRPARGGRENLIEVIKHGTESGMPAFPLPENQIATLVAYVRDLRAPAAERPPQGNAENGARFFAGQGDCTRCHMVNGSGGTLGPDLSNIGRERRVQQIEQALRQPGTSGMAGYQAVSLRLLDGSTVRGVARNESTFDLQLQTFETAICVRSPRARSRSSRASPSR